MIWYDFNLYHTARNYTTCIYNWSKSGHGQSFEDSNIYVTTTNNKYTKSFNISLLNKIVRKKCINY